MTAPLSALLVRLLSDPLAVAVIEHRAVPRSIVEQVMSTPASSTVKACQACGEPITEKARALLLRDHCSLECRAAVRVERSPFRYRRNRGGGR